MTAVSIPLPQPHDDTSEGHWLITRPGEHCLIRVPASKTNGAYSVVEIVSAPGDSTPMHTHENEDEHFFIVEGTARIAVGDRVFDATPGDSITLHRNVPHAWGNPTDSPLRLVVITTPGGVEDSLRAIAGSEIIDWEAFEERYRVHVVGPLLIPK